jgi:hypothetical protein
VVIGILRKIAFSELVWARLFCLRWIARPIAFALPMPFVAAWCGLEPSWSLVAWTVFCVTWYGWVDGIGKKGASPTAADHRHYLELKKGGSRR